MSDIKVPMRLVLDNIIAGRNIDNKPITQRAEIQNDATCLYQILDAVPTQEEKYKTHRRRVRRIRRELRPLVRVAENTDAPFDGVVGEIEISDEALKWLVDLFDDAPEGVIVRGAAVETAEDIADLYDEVKNAEKREAEK